MMPDRATTRKFEELVKTAIGAGRSGRAEIIRQLAGLSPDKLAQVPPSALALIGPEGLAALARTRSDMAGLSPRPKAASPATQEVAVAASGKKSKPFLSTLWLCGTLVVAAMSFETVGELVDWFSHKAPMPLNAGAWPRCERLDRRTDGCVYKTGGSDLTLQRAAQYLRIEQDELARLNRHLSGAVTGPLAPGSLIVVLRDPNRLIGETQ